VYRPTPATYSPPNLLIVDPNPLPPVDPLNPEAHLNSVARDAAQSLIAHLLTTCPLSSTSDGVLLSLPPSATPLIPLPREKRLPPPKQATKWEKFAAKKGISKKRKGETGEGGRANKVFDDATQEWVPRWGYKGINKREEGQWLVEVDEKAEKEGKESGGRYQGRAERKEGVKRNERLQRANERRSRKSGGA
jgi:regulator of ribosome biosynthesis